MLRTEWEMFAFSEVTLLYFEGTYSIIYCGIFLINVFVYAEQSFILLRKYIRNLSRYMRRIILEPWLGF